jgi:hypothetical protein
MPAGMGTFTGKGKQGIVMPAYTYAFSIGVYFCQIVRAKRYLFYRIRNFCPIQFFGAYHRD